MENTLGQWFSKCDPQINSITITWELVWNVNSWTPPVLLRALQRNRINKQDEYGINLSTKKFIIRNYLKQLWRQKTQGL
jgi:hypothetical protein